MIQLGQRLLAVIGLVTAGILAVWLWMSWEQLRVAQIARMTATVKLLAAHADHYFASVGNKLEAIADDLQAADLARDPQQLVDQLALVRAGNPDIVSMTVMRADGKIVAATGPSVRTDIDWRKEFDKALKISGLSIGRPQQALLDAQWILPLRYTTRAANGKIRYVILAGIPLERQQQLWRSLEFSADAALGLWRDDGYLLSRIPADPEGNVYRQPTAGGSLNNAVRAQPHSGSYEGTVIDGSSRIGVYQQLGKRPIYAFLSHLRSTLVAMWWQQVRLPLVLVLGFLVTIFLAYWQLAARYSSRMRNIEAQLTQPGTAAGAVLPIIC